MGKLWHFVKVKMCHQMCPVRHKSITSVIIFLFQDPIINISELKEIHSEINLTVPDPILLSNLHDGLEAVRLQLPMEFNFPKAIHDMRTVGSTAMVQNVP